MLRWNRVSRVPSGVPATPPATPAGTTGPRLLVLLAAVLFSTGGAAIKATAMTPWQVTSFRSGVAALALLVLLPGSHRGWTRRTLAVAVAYAGTLMTFVLSNKLTTAANAIFLQSTAPLYVLLFGPWLLKERLGRRDLGLVAVLAAGMALFFVGTEPAVSTAPSPLRGNAVAVVSGVFWAATILGLRWAGQSDGEAARTVLAGNALAFLAALPIALPVAAVAPSDAAILLYLGVVQIGLAYVCVTRAMPRVTAVEASLLLMLEPVLNPVFAWMVHAERPGPFALAGGVLVLAATVVRALRA